MAVDSKLFFFPSSLNLAGLPSLMYISLTRRFRRSIYNAIHINRARVCVLNVCAPRGVRLSERCAKTLKRGGGGGGGGGVVT